MREIKLHRMLIVISLLLVAFSVAAEPPTILAKELVQTPTTDVSVGLTFNPSNIALQSESRLTITLNNANTTDALTSAEFSSLLPAGLVLSASPNLDTNCGGSVTADGGTTSISLSGGTVPASGSCYVKLSISATASGTHTFSMAAGDVQGYFNTTHVENANPASADLIVATFDFNAEINKQFSPINIAPGDVSRMSVNIYNSNTFQLENASWTDNLIGVQPGLTIADPPNVSTVDCGTPTVTAVAGSTTLSLSGATVPAKVGNINGVCSVFVDVTSTTPGNLINTVPAGNLNSTGPGATTVSNTDPASATLQVDAILPPSISKSFFRNTVYVGQISRLTIRITNTDIVHTIDELTLTDTLPTNIVLASTVNPSLSGCGSSASLTANSGSDTITISNAEIGPSTVSIPTVCTIAVNVVSSVQGEYTNTIPVNEITTRQGVTNDDEAQADLNVQAVTIDKDFADSTILAGDTTTLTITLNNPSDEDYTGVSLDDVMPGSDLYFTGTPSTTCGAGTVTIQTTSRADDTLRLSGGTIPSGTVGTPGSCTITGTVTTGIGADDYNHYNSIPANALTVTSHPGVTNIYPTGDSLRVEQISIDLYKSFSPVRFEENGTSRVTIQMRNPTSSIAHVTTFTDNLPTGLTAVTGTGSTTCNNGQVGITSTAVTLSGLTGDGAEIPAGSVTVPGTCSFSFDVTATTAGSYNNYLPTNSVVTVEGVSNEDAASRSVTVYTEGYGMSGSKSFSNSRILAGENSRLRIYLYAPEDTAISDLVFTDVLPTGLEISNSSAAVNTCNGTLSAPTGSDTISLTGGSITQDGSCRIDVYVTADESGVYTNTVDNDTQISTGEGQTTASDLTATLTVTNLSIRKAFYPDEVAPTGHTILTVTFENTNTEPLINLTATDNLNTMNQGYLDGTEFTIADPANASTTCAGGTVTAVPGTTTFSISGGTIPAQVGSIPGICTVEVELVASGPFSTLPIAATNTMYRTNVSATLSSASLTMNPVNNASDSLTVTPLEVGVVKGFDPLTVFGGSASTMSVQLINPNTSPLNEITFTDVMPSGMYIADPPNFNVGTCSGSITGTPGSDTFTFSDGFLLPGKRCTLTLSVTMNVNGNRTNVIPIAGVTTFNGAENAYAAEASLTNLPGASISKHFTPAEIVLGETSLLTISIKNTGNIPLSNMNLTDNLPSGLTIAASPAPTNGCNGMLTATAGTSVITLGAGSIAPGPDTVCDITVPIEADSPGDFTNTIATNSLTTSEGATNTEPAEDTLTVKASPSMQLTKNLNVGSSDSLPYLAGDTLVYDLVVTNTGDIDLTNVTLSDPGLTGITCTPTQPTTLAPTETMTCSGSHVLTSDEETAGSYTNTATADSDETDPVTDSVTVPANQSDLLSINKELLTSGPYEIGDILNYTITVSNLGSSALSNVIVSDPDAVIGTCTPAIPVATLSAGASITCSASYEIVQADVDAETFTNTATADSDETDPVTDSVTIPIEDNASINVDKQVISSGPYDTVGARIEYDISVINTGDQTLTNVTITDPGVDVVMGACTPTQPAILAPGEILSCYAYHDVTSADITAGGFSNTAYGDSDQTEPASDTANVITQTPLIQLEKTGVLNDGGDGRADAGDVINYTFTVTNIGQVTLTNVVVSDIVGGVTVTGTPIANMDPGDVDNTSYSGSYTLTQADIDAGTFHNYASVTGDPPVGSTVSDVDDDEQTLTADPELTLTKTGTFNDESTDSLAQPGETISYSFTVENTGNVTLTNITLADNVGGITVSGGPIASLDPGDSDSSTFTATYTITQDDVDAGTFHNVATVTGTPPIGDDITDDGDEDVTLPQSPSIEVVKTGTLHNDVVAPNTQTNVGDQITYTFRVENTGNVTLSDVDITDAVAGVVISGGPIASMAPGAVDTATFTATYTLTQADVDAGTFTNTATVTGSPDVGDDVTDDDTDTKTFVAEPSITLTKSGTLDMTIVAPSTEANVGDQIDYAFTVTNTGNVTLTNVNIADTLAGVTITGTIASLAPGASDSSTISGVYTLTQGDIDTGSVDNSATVTGTPPTGLDVTDGDTDTVSITHVPEITLTKTGTLDNTIVLPTTQSNPGDQITYAFTVTNTGNVTLTNITLADTVGGITINGGPTIASLDPGASDSSTFTGTYTLTQTDVDAGTFTNTATTTGTPPVGGDVTDDDSDTRTLAQSPSISLVKTGTPNNGGDGRMDPGDTISYSFTVTNTGNVTLRNITIDDIVAGVNITGTITSLAPGAVDNSTITGSYTLTQADVDAGTFTNTATVTGSPDVGDDVTDDDSDTQPITAAPSISLSKVGTIDDTIAAPSGEVNVGDQINYVFTVTNTGNVTLTNINITDTVGGVTISGGPIASLAGGASDSSTITGVYTITQADIDAGIFHNEASVSGTDPNSTVVNDTDDDDQTLTAVPEIELQKTGTLDDTVVAPNGVVNAGDVISYEFTITNTGNVTLSDITLTDTIGGVTISGGPTIASLAPGASDTSTFTGSYTLTQADVDAGTFTNTATAEGTDPHSTDVSDDDNDSKTFASVPSISLEKTGTLNMDVVSPDDRADIGDTITYVFRIENTGNTTLHNVTVTDSTSGVILTGTPITLAPGEVNDTAYSAVYTLTLADIDLGTFLNEASVSGRDPSNTEVTDDDDDEQNLVDQGLIGVAKDVVTGPTLVSPGTWQFTYQIYVENAGNVTLSDIQVTDDLYDVFGDMVFTVLDVRSTDFVLNPAYDGLPAPTGDIELLDGTDVLLPGESGIIEIDIEFIPENGGPFENTATAVGKNPNGNDVEDDSQDGVDPDPDNDDDPTNNNEPTPLEFGGNIFDPPFGIKVFDNAGLPLLQWTMTWINDSNIVGLDARVSDEIPPNSTFYDDGIPSGYPLPTGTHPTGTTTNGVVCEPEAGYTGTSTTTTYCYYEGPTIEYPRGRIIWEGTLGPDLGATNAIQAVNEIYISFHVRVNNLYSAVTNIAEIGADLDGDGDIENEEVVVADASATLPGREVPDTGFAPGAITQLPAQPLEKAYSNSGIVIEIPSLGIEANIVTVPFGDGSWDVTWLGDDVGYLEGSAYPTWKGNTVLTAHNWTALNRPGLFVDLGDLSYGDQIVIHAFGMTYTYEVRSHRLASNNDLGAVFQHEELDWITLLTCDWFDEDTGEYRYRRIVRAVLVSVAED